MSRPTNAAWLSEMAGKPVQPPRREEVQDLVDSRPFWDSLADLSNLPEHVEVHEDVLLRERDGTPLTAEIYVPTGAGPFPLLLHFHGGGFCVSRARNDRKFGMQWAQRGFVVLNLEYGLAPEHPFPWAVEDALYAARWLLGNAPSYKGDASLGVVIEGGSAGAGLAASTVLALDGLTEGLDEGELAGVDVPVSAVALFFGMHDFALLLSEPGSNVGSAELWNRAYLGPHFTTRLRHPLASQVHAPNLSCFPPTYVSCGSADSLLGHSLAFGKALASAGVQLTLSVVPGLDHGYAKMGAKIPAAAREVERVQAWVDEILSNEGGES